MQYPVTYAAGMHLLLSKIGSEIWVILYTYRPDNILSEQWCENLWLFFEARRILWANNSGETLACFETLFMKDIVLNLCNVTMVWNP